ncbi:hypothetical protein ELH24_21770 [Rhizobium ruizarguesonis]|uniref:hypothetical protein n=1 Tax=Rhizobium ruizarguesonis TaxID=2081791 RepID=UPI001030841A|nr:hypothetical protein [Rhizobium ruizarguesonis]TBD01834.1 hypothetical protein ELH25_25490 [Rhizobium ruizarguesonis]TBD17980.1 hypothetical protein ELH24_21770 [Rhizobium ruizarguesonis]TBE99223.1 hypothetical protein ELG98_22885 [Rhizobium ruizarguesonis]
MSDPDEFEYRDDVTSDMGNEPTEVRSEQGYSDTASRLESSIAASAAPANSNPSDGETSYFDLGIRWAELGIAAAEKVFDEAVGYVQGEAVEKILRALAGEAAAHAFGTISTVLDAVESTELHDYEITPFDKLNPSEQREIRLEALKYRALVPDSMPPSGPVIKRSLIHD